MMTYCPNAFTLADQDIARDLFGAKNNETVSELAGNGISTTSGGLVSPSAGKHLFHAAIGSLVGRAIFGAKSPGELLVSAGIGMMLFEMFGQWERPC